MACMMVTTHSCWWLKDSGKEILNKTEWFCFSCSADSDSETPESSLFSSS